ncbi:helix-turn-helix domain-containing protein [uncultured Brachyspira sp.]|uniref:helix-turn-helix domain-containing protein n=1 Tax=uncultured Brachyspira sp. TaxID=221953 RepID=UPI0026322855|nr:helix-turn-helix domain-containing protein [uncultured Brachyspira sp.]
MNNKNYYTIIPSSIRYDKRLKSLSKLIYGEIAALTNDKGYCWANNNYFAEIYSVSKDTISRSVKQLEKYNYIKCVYDKTKQNNEKRKIYIKKFNLVPAKNPIQYSENFSDGIDKKAEDNNKYNNLNNKDSELKKDTNKLNSTDNKKDSPSPCFEFNIFVNELIDTFNFLTGNKASKLYHLHSFKTKGRQEEIKSIFEDRRYDWKGCINLAKNKVKDKDNLSGIWLDFLSYLKIYLIKGDRENTIKRHYSKEELIKREEKLKEIELIKIQKEREEKLKLLEEEKRLGFDKMTEDEIIEFTKRNLMFLKHA